MTRSSSRRRRSSGIVVFVFVFVVVIVAVVIVVVVEPGEFTTYQRKGSIQAPHRNPCVELDFYCSDWDMLCLPLGIGIDL